MLGPLVGGELRTGGDRTRIAILDPATEEPVAELALATPDDVDDALAAAAAAFAAWRETTSHERAALLRDVAERVDRDAERLALIVTEDEGKPLAESRAEVAAAVASIEWVAEECKRTYGRIVPARDRELRLTVEYEPIGPVAAFSPWNFPAFNPGRKMATAVAAGCSVIHKPSEETPRAALEIARHFLAAGAPPGLVSVLVGDPPALAKQLIESPIVRMVAFTGSVAVGKQLTTLAAADLTHVVMELGGHAPALVLADADVDDAASVLVAGRFRNAGQVCVAPSRFFVHRSLHDRFVDAVVERVESIAVGDGRADGTTMGPLANARRLAAMEAFVADAVGKGARVRTGGERIGAVGHFFAPTVLSDVPADADVLREEIFGPIAPIVAFEDEDEALERANELPLGLAAFVFGRDVGRAQALARRIEAGTVAINDNGVAVPELPFGGVKDSGIGRESGAEGIREHLVVKSITTRSPR